MSKFKKFMLKLITNIIAGGLLAILLIVISFCFLLPMVDFVNGVPIKFSRYAQIIANGGGQLILGLVIVGVFIGTIFDIN